MINRRRLLTSALAAPFAAGLPMRLAFAAGGGERRLLVVILRGGLDGLMAVPAWGDPDYARQREGLGPGRPGERDGALDLDGFFGLHPDLRGMHELWQRDEFLPVHAVATPYRERSHFDAQNVLEHGLARPDRTGDGWLNRALAAMGPAADGHERAMAVGQTVPLLLRGDAPVASWAPEVLPGPDEDTMARLQSLYAHDEALGPRLAMAMEADAMAGDGDARTRGQLARQLASAAGGLLSHDGGPNVAVMEMGGWDSHANQNAKAFQLRVLDEALGDFRAAMGERWGQTIVLMITEFGRTVAVNGTRGTDHGTGAAAFLLGGNVRGGRVLTDWPGLGRGDLLDGRDLRPTLDLRHLCAAVLHDHLRMPSRIIARDVFPDAAPAPQLGEIVRV